MSSVDEAAFEAQIAGWLVEHGGYRRVKTTGEGYESGFDGNAGVDTADLFEFIGATQGDRWDKLVDSGYGGDPVAARAKFVQRLASQLDKRGTVDVLRRGVTDYNVKFRLAYFKPGHGLAPELVERYEANILSVVRQFRYEPKSTKAIDLGLFVNGIPVATAELKNPLTGQSVEHAMLQYRNDRDPRNRTLKRVGMVHFAVDPYSVSMTTHLAGKRTRFLPFNQGHDLGAGNPPNPDGCRTAYLWERVWSRDAWLDILGRFIHVEKPSLGSKARPTVIFPRFHQWDAVRRLEADAKTTGAGRNYLVQHSAGSGKSNSIAWLAHRFSSLHNQADQKVFDKVVVITDRIILDRQLQDTISQFEHALGVVQSIDKDSSQLAKALAGEQARIIVTTLQKFPFVFDHVLSLPERTYAVIVDEAHSSQTGEAAKELRRALGTAEVDIEDEATDAETLLADAVAARGRQPNLSFFAFTATPKGKTIELFGRRAASGMPEAFHIYSMRQAIEEGFILDVLRNYTDYDTYYRIARTAADDPEYPQRSAAKALSKYTSIHPHNLTQKTEVIIEHFRANVRHRMGGKAKAMVVTSSRLHAVRYMRAFEDYINQKGYTDIRPLVAFSGTVTDPDTGEDFTEPGMNTDIVSGKPISESALPSRFDSPDYQILLVAEKYQTGFDQPLLQAMYVDKRLDGVQAVQTLSRLNRVAPGKSDPFVLDFVNNPEDIGAAFAPYYDQTELEAQSDPIVLDGLKHELDEMQVYHHDEVERFAQVYFQPFDKLQKSDHAMLMVELQPAVGRFRELDDDEQARFRDRLGAFVRLYAFISQIIPYADGELEQLAAFARRLLPSLRDDMAEQLRLEDEVELEYYRLQHVSTGAIDLNDDGPTVRSPTEVGTGRTEEDEAPLSEIIASLNDRFGTAFNESDRLFFEQIQEDGVNDENISQTATANSFEKFELAIRQELPKLMIDRMADNDEIVKRCLNDPAFQEIVFAGLAKGIYETVTAQ